MTSKIFTNIKKNIDKVQFLYNARSCINIVTHMWQIHIVESSLDLIHLRKQGKEKKILKTNARQSFIKEV